MLFGHEMRYSSMTEINIELFVIIYWTEMPIVSDPVIEEYLVDNKGEEMSM